MRLVLTLCLFIVIINGSPVMKREHLSSPRDGVGGIQIADRFYFVGGFEFNDYIPTNIVDIYNITSKKWEEPIYLDGPRGWISTAVIGQNVYFIGGAKYDGNCVMLYNTSIHQYSSIGCGPTVRQAIQISNHNSTVTVLGSFSADFYNASNQWYYYPTLTSWMQQISGGLKIVYENLIIGIGGANITTTEPLYNAWIFDTSTQNLTVFDTFTSFVDLDSNNPSLNFVSANGKIIIFTADRFFAHDFGTTQWFELPMINAIRAVALSDVAFMFNSTGYFKYTWGTNTRDATWTPDTLISRDHLLVFENQLAMISGVDLLIYETGALNQLTLSYYVDKIAPLGTTQYFLYSNNYPFQIYDSKARVLIVTTQGMTQVQSVVPFDDNNVVLFDGSQAGVYNAQAPSLTMQSAQMVGEFLIGTDIVSIRDQKVFINLISAIDLSPKASPVLKSKDASAVTQTVNMQDYLYIDVYNYAQKQMQQQKIFINMTSSFYIGQKFVSVAAIDDMLIVMKGSATFRYNTTSGESFETIEDTTTSKIASFTPFSTVASVKVVNSMGHLPGSVPHSIFAVDATATTLIQKPETGATTKQYVTSEDNVIYMSATVSDKFRQMYTYDGTANDLQTFSLPVAQDRVIVGITNDTLVVLGGDGYVYAVKLNDYSTWYQSSLSHDYIPTISHEISNGMIMIAGGKHVNYTLYTDEILFINVSAIIEEGVQLSVKPPVASVIEQPTTTPSGNIQGTTGLTEGELVAAIVVPVVVVIAGVILLAVLLVKRRNKKRRGGSVTSLGLESRFGDWFTPFNQITFGDQLGQGSSGQVFKGTWKSTAVALKVSMAQANTTVISELELMMQLRPHPNVVQLLGFSVHPETASIILIIEFCEGGSLDTRLYDDKGDISMTDKVQWLQGIAKGLSHLHSNNIVHRDVAARNVLLHRNEPKFTDFGMSRLINEQTQRGTTKSELGPIRWMSPESLKNKEYSAKSDIWSFGILMYEVVARQEPHSDADPIEIGRLIRDSGLTPVIPSTCHPQLAEIMKQCWQMSPQSRPKIESIIESLESIQIH